MTLGVQTMTNSVMMQAMYPEAARQTSAHLYACLYYSRFACRARAEFHKQTTTTFFRSASLGLSIVASIACIFLLHLVIGSDLLTGLFVLAFGLICALKIGPSVVKKPKHTKPAIAPVFTYSANSKVSTKPAHVSPLFRPPR